MSDYIMLGLFVGRTFMFDYTDHHGELGQRVATFKDVEIIGSGNAYYPKGTVCFRMSAHDRDMADRSFAIEKIDFETWRAV